MNDLAVALEHCERLLEKQPRQAEVRAREILNAHPGDVRARHLLGASLRRQSRYVEARAALEPLLAAPDVRLETIVELGAVLTQLNDMEAVLSCYERLIRIVPQDAQSWVLYGNALKTVGRTPEATAAYRHALKIKPDSGQSYWHLSNLKTVPLTAADFVDMTAQLQRAYLPRGERVHLAFAAGKAAEDAGDFETAFRYFAMANALHRATFAYSADATHAFCERLSAFFTREFFASKAGYGTSQRDAIFIVGLPRSGSTLVEQILASHSQVESTRELAEVSVIARGIDAAGVAAGGRTGYPEALRELSPERAAAFGAAYLNQTRTYRRTARPFFIDKMPNNFFHVGLIHLITPNAKIVDVRRHPMACGLSCFKQHFPPDQPALYDLTDIGRLYSDYVSLMEHFDAALPGQIYRVSYETLVVDPEGETRRLLEHCGLPFESACLQFHQTTRNIHTVSSEQVREPIFNNALENWRSYEPWLSSLRAALGSKFAISEDARAVPSL